MRKLLAFLLPCLLLVSCAGRQSAELEHTTALQYSTDTKQPAPDLRALPPLPRGHQSSGLLETSLNGADTLSRAGSAVDQNTDLALGSASSSLSWGLWEFPASDELRYLDLQLTVDTQAGGEVYLALADYSTGRWELQGPVVSGRVLELDPLKYSSPASTMYAAVLVWNGGAATVDKLSLIAFHSNAAPSADLQADLTSAQAPVFIDFDASGSSDADPGDSIVRYYWDFDGDGQFEAITFAPIALYQFTAAGVFDATVVVEDRDGATDSATVQITITPANQPPVAGLTLFPNEISIGGEVSFDAALSTDPDGSIVNYQYDWNGDGSYDFSSTNPVSVQQIAEAGSFRIGLRVTDNGGASATTTALLRVHGFNQSHTFFDPNSDAGEHSSLCVVDGRPAIAFYDPMAGSLSYVRASTTGTPTFWNDAPLPVDTTGDSGRFCSLNIINGRPAISYYKDQTGQLMYVRALDADGLQWATPVPLTIVADQGRYTCLRVVDGFPAISFQRVDTEDQGYIRAEDADGMSWGTPIYPETSGQSGYYSSMQVMDGKPGICYYDMNGLDLRIVLSQDADGTSWGGPINIEGGPGDTGAYCSLCVLQSGYPAVAYRIGSGFNTVRYARANNFEGSSWGLPQSIDNSGSDTGYFCSLAVVQGRPAVAYYDMLNGQLRYTQAQDLEGNLWPAGFSIVDQGSVGRYCSLQEVYGGPAISYYSDLFTDLKYVSGF